MPIPMRLAAFLVPVFGLPYSLWLRPHSPFAANQGIISSLAGLAIYAAVYFGRHFL
ncbi:hypothetical protein IAD21_01389 [Abditibacteriota bacterium]|nr:hypothetical protein IAD21_01389 [Abditibacteriota bacterium]